MRGWLGLPLAALALGGCGPIVDDPGNVPKLGRWERNSKLLALVANDVWVDRKDLPLQLPDDETEVKNCIEPKIKSSEELNADLMRKAERLCTLGPLQWDGQHFASTGSCGPDEKEGYTVTGTMELTGQQAEERASAKVSAALVLRKKDGSAERVRFGVETRWKRLGDCGTS